MTDAAVTMTNLPKKKSVFFSLKSQWVISSSEKAQRVKEPMTDHEEKKNSLFLFLSRYIKGYRDIGIKNTWEKASIVACLSLHHRKIEAPVPLVVSPPHPPTWRRVMFHMYSRLFEPSPPLWSRISHFSCKKSFQYASFPLFFTQISICYKLNTSISLSDKYYLAHIGTELVYKTTVTPSS